MLRNAPRQCYYVVLDMLDNQHEKTCTYHHPMLIITPEGHTDFSLLSEAYPRSSDVQRIPDVPAVLATKLALARYHGGDRSS
jgi:hypothetical protein